MRFVYKTGHSPLKAFCFTLLTIIILINLQGLWSSQRVNTLSIPPSAVLPFINQALNMRSTIVAYEVCFYSFVLFCCCKIFYLSLSVSLRRIFENMTFPSHFSLWFLQQISSQYKQLVSCSDHGGGGGVQNVITSSQP